MYNLYEHSPAFRISFLFLLIFLIFSGISISVSQIAIALSLIAWLFGILKGYNDIEYQKSGMERYILVFVIVSFVLALLSPSVVLNLLYIRDFWLISIMLLASSLINTRNDVKKIVKVIIFIALLNVIVGTLQLITDIDFVNAIKYGMKHERANLSIGNRHIVGFLGHHLTFGGYMMIITLPLLYLTFLKKNDTKGIPGILIRLSAVLSFVVVILIWARSIIISLPASSFPLFFKRKKTFLISVTSIFVLIIIIFSIFGPSRNIKKNLFNFSSSVRFVIWRSTIQVWLRHPLIGSGGGNFKKEFIEELKKYSIGKEHKKIIEDIKKYKWSEHEEIKWKLIHYKRDIEKFIKKGTHAHNDYINQLARKGIFGFIAFIYMLFGILKYMISNLKYIDDRFSRYLYMGLFGAFCCFLSASLFQCYYTDEENLAMFWFIIGFMTAIVKIEKRNSFQ